MSSLVGSRRDSQVCGPVGGGELLEDVPLQAGPVPAQVARPGLDRVGGLAGALDGLLRGGLLRGAGRRGVRGAHQMVSTSYRSRSGCPAEDRHALDARLGDEQPVARVAVMTWQAARPRSRGSIVDRSSSRGRAGRDPCPEPGPPRRSSQLEPSGRVPSSRSPCADGAEQDLAPGAIRDDVGRGGVRRSEPETQSRNACVSSRTLVIGRRVRAGPSVPRTRRSRTGSGSSKSSWITISAIHADRLARTRLGLDRRRASRPATRLARS